MLLKAKDRIGINDLPRLDQYPVLIEKLLELPEAQARSKLRRLYLSDLYALIRYGLRRFDFDHPWLFARCREVQSDPDGVLDLWSRGHRKSSIITFGLTIQEIIINQNITIGIFSHTRPAAKSFLKQIKHELERNGHLKNVFSDVFYSEPKRESPKWSEDEGLVVRRTGNTRECTVEAWGLVDGQPIGKHFDLCIYDDIVTHESVSSPEMIAKTTDAWSLSLSLIAEGGRRRYIGTRYHQNDTWAEMLRRGGARARIHPATDDGTSSGNPVLFTRHELNETRRIQGVYNFASQYLLNPVADEAQGFKNEWVKYYDTCNMSSMVRWIIIDPANAKKKTSDYTAGWVIGFSEDGTAYVLDAVRDRLNLVERTALLFNWHRKYRPHGVGYEQYGMQADIQHINDMQEKDNYRFKIYVLRGQLSKVDRIRRMIPLFEQGTIYFPRSLYRTNYEKKTEDLILTFLEDEYKSFPVSRHDDMLDSLSRICDDDIQRQVPKPMGITIGNQKGMESESSLGWT